MLIDNTKLFITCKNYICVQHVIIYLYIIYIHVPSRYSFISMHTVCIEVFRIEHFQMPLLKNFDSALESEGTYTHVHVTLEINVNKKMRREINFRILIQCCSTTCVYH